MIYHPYINQEQQRLEKKRLLCVVFYPKLKNGLKNTF